MQSKFKPVPGTNIELVHHFPQSAIIKKYDDEKRKRNLMCVRRFKQIHCGGAVCR